MPTVTEVVLTSEWFGRLRQVGRQWAETKPLTIESRLDLGAGKWAREAVVEAETAIRAMPGVRPDEGSLDTRAFLQWSAVGDFFLRKDALTSGDRRGEAFETALQTPRATQAIRALAEQRLATEQSSQAPEQPRITWAMDEAAALSREITPSGDLPASRWACLHMRSTFTAARMLLLALGTTEEPQDVPAAVGTHAAPPPSPFGVSDEGAERLVAAWMRHLGAPDAAVTRYSGDGGIDVLSSKYVVQVKNYGREQSVAIASIRELHGVATLEARAALFFTSGLYPPSALALADRAAMALFTYDAEAGTLKGANHLGKRLRSDGL